MLAGGPRHVEGGVDNTMRAVAAMVDSVVMLVSRTGLSPVMVGRGAELARLRRLLERAADPQVALVDGEAGVGKTRLVQELLTVLPDGVTVLAGQAEQGGPGRPYQLLLEAVGPFVSDWTALPEPLAGREQALRLLLAPVAPALGANATMPEPTAAPDQAFPAEALLRGAVDLVRHLVTRTSGSPRAERASPALIVLEDLHWADPDSLTLLSRLASSPDLPVLLLGTYRAEAVDRRLTDLMADLERRRSVDHVTLRRLRRAEVIELLGAVYRRPIPASVADALQRRTAGNPFFIEELLVAAGNAPPEELPALPLPANLTEALLRHLDGLGPEQRRVVDAAARAGASHYLQTGSTFQALDLAELALEEAGADLRLLELAVRAAWSIGLLARLRWELGELEAHRRVVNEALAVAERLGPSEEKVLVYNLAAETAFLYDDLDGTLVWADRALSLAEQVGTPAAVPAILANKGSALLWLPGRADQGVALLERVIDEGEAHGEPLVVLRAFNNLLMAVHHLWPAERSHALLDQWAAVVERLGRLDWLVSVANARAILLSDVEGDLPGARAALSGLPPPAVEIRTPEAFWTVLLDATLSIEAGDLDEAGQRIAQARRSMILSNELDRHLSERRLEADAIAVRAAAAAGRLDEAVGLLEGIVALATAATTTPAWLLSIWFRALREVLRAGLEPGEARRLHGSIPATARSPVPFVDPAWPDHLQGALAEAEGEHEQALV